jgi:hypothetical protein
MKRPFHELSDREKREVAEALMMTPSAFGVLVVVVAARLGNVRISLVVDPTPDRVGKQRDRFSANSRLPQIARQLGMLLLPRRWLLNELARAALLPGIGR